MSLNLQKGQKIDLTKTKPGLSKLLIGLGWDTNKYSGGFDFDLDATVFLLKGDNKVSSNQDFVYYGNLVHSSGSVEHMGDNLTGGTGGDDEQIKVDLNRVPDNIERIAIAVTIYDAQTNEKLNRASTTQAAVSLADGLMQFQTPQSWLDAVQTHPTFTPA